MSDADQIRFRGAFLQFVQRDNWEFVQRNNCHAVVGIAAMTPQQEVILVEQYRPPVQCRVIEIPAGLVGDGEHAEDDLIAGARRELLEETGFIAENWQVLYSGPSSAGLSDESVHILRAIGLRRVEAGGGLDDEDITVHVIPFAEVHDWLQSRIEAGQTIDHKVFAALHWLAQDPEPS